MQSLLGEVMTQKLLAAKKIVDREVPQPPVISRDGKLIAFQVSPSGYKGDAAKHPIWISRDGEPARKFTSGTGADSSPAWSPDGSKLAFLSNREDDKKSQVFVIPVDGGEAAALGDELKDVAA